MVKDKQYGQKLFFFLCGFLCWGLCAALTQKVRNYFSDNPISWNSAKHKLFNKKTAFAVGLGALAYHQGWFGKIKEQLFDKKEPEYPVYPIVFHPRYDVSILFGIEGLLHPFDGKKYGKVAKSLKKSFNISSFYEPRQPISDQALEIVHDPDYVRALSYNKDLIARIAEVFVLAYLPNWLLQRNLLTPMRWATAGTVMAAQLAMKQGWAINLSGGYHHAKAEMGGGFCFFADIPLAIRALREKHPDLKVLVVDLDAHRGNGVESVVNGDSLTWVFDMYSSPNYPDSRKDGSVRPVPSNEKVDFAFPLENGIHDAGYLKILRDNLPAAIEKVQPGIIFYNAGTDVYAGDRLGRMKVSKEGIMERDLFVFQQATKHKIPICMTLSGGYSTESHAIVSASIKQIIETLFSAS